MKHYSNFLIAIAGLLLVGGCATSRSVVNVEMRKSAVEASQGAAVKIVDVVDARVFERAPKTPEIPSLKNDADIGNPAITARAIARKRNGYGMALGDVLLPEGQTVSALVGQALAEGFRQGGYRVVSPGTADYDQAVAIHARVVKYWSWSGWGVHNQTEVKLIGALPVLKDGLTVSGAATDMPAVTTESVWQELSTKGLESTSKNLAAILQSQSQIN